MFTSGRVCLKTGQEGDNKHALGRGAPVGQRSEEGHQRQRWEKQLLTAAETQAKGGEHLLTVICRCESVSVGNSIQENRFEIHK